MARKKIFDSTANDDEIVTVTLRMRLVEKRALRSIAVEVDSDTSNFVFDLIREHTDLDNRALLLARNGRIDDQSGR